MKQKFTLHTHNNELRFDGISTAKEMLDKAQSLGFETIGVTNHLVVNKGLSKWAEVEPMYFDNFDEMCDVCKRHIEIVNELKSNYKMNVLVGFEADFFCDKEWRINFEKMIGKLDVDYLIGTTHFLKNKDESFLCNIYHYKHLDNVSEEDLDNYVRNHFENIIESIKCGYYSFIAHLDYCSIFNLGIDKKYDEYKYRMLEALKEYKKPYEINTSGYDRLGRPHPDIWMIEEAKRLDIPVVLSDDAHSVDQLGRHFDKAEALLDKIGYTNRFSLDMLKKPL